MHLVQCFVAGTPKTQWGVYVDFSRVTVDPKKMTCGRCKKVVKQWRP